MLHIVDDEAVVRDSLTWLATSRAISARTYCSGAQFLAQVEAGQFDIEGDCVLLDVRMPDMNGVAVFDQLAVRGLTQRMPVIFLTGHGDVPMAVDTLKRGAFDFFEKPFNDNQLMDRVQEGLAGSRRPARWRPCTRAWRRCRRAKREVLDLILAGKMNKVVADQLGISMRTVEVHRAHIFDKMQGQNRRRTGRPAEVISPSASRSTRRPFAPAPAAGRCRFLALCCGSP
jgi:two-component system response regulator DctR